MAFTRLIKDLRGLRFRTTKTKAALAKRTAYPLINQNFPAEKAYRLLESILATKYSRHKLID